MMASCRPSGERWCFDDYFLHLRPRIRPPGLFRPRPPSRLPLDSLTPVSMMARTFAEFDSPSLIRPRTTSCRYQPPWHFASMRAMSRYLTTRRVAEVSRYLSFTSFATRFRAASHRHRPLSLPAARAAPARARPPCTDAKRLPADAQMSCRIVSLSHISLPPYFSNLRYRRQLTFYRKCR